MLLCMIVHVEQVSLLSAWTLEWVSLIHLIIWCWKTLSPWLLSMMMASTPASYGECWASPKAEEKHRNPFRVWRSFMIQEYPHEHCDTSLFVHKNEATLIYRHPAKTHNIALLFEENMQFMNCDLQKLQSDNQVNLDLMKYLRSTRIVRTSWDLLRGLRS